MHATKTAAQLDREIAEALAGKDKPTTWMQRKALYDRGEPSGCDTFLLTYLPYHDMAPYKSSSAYGYGSYEECFDTRELANRRLQQLRKEGRIEWAKIYQDDSRYPLGRKLVDEWSDSDQDEPAHATIKRAASPLKSSPTRPINKRKRVRHFSETKDKKGDTHYYVTYEDRTGHGITSAELARYRQHEQGRASHATKADRPLVESIQAGDRVTIVDRFGTERTGRAVMRGPHGWVLNMGGRHGTPGIASADNVTRVRCGKK